MSLHSRTQKILHVNSRNRLLPKSTDSSNFKISLGNQNALSEVKGIVIKEIELINSFYNIEYYNNRFYYKTLTVEDYVEIERGQYNINQLITALIAQWSLKGITMLITIDNIKNVLTFNASQTIEYYYYRDNMLINPMGDVLGILKPSVGEVLSFTANSLPNLCGVRSVHIHSKELAQGHGIDSKGYSTDLVASVPLDSAFGEIQYLTGKEEPDVHIYDDHAFKNLKTISIILKDEDGNVLRPNGGDFNMIIKIFH